MSGSTACAGITVGLAGACSGLLRSDAHAPGVHKHADNRMGILVILFTNYLLSCVGCTLWFADGKIAGSGTLASTGSPQTSTEKLAIRPRGNPYGVIRKS